VPEQEPDFEDILETTKKAAAILRDADIPFVVAGGLASWARGGPETEHDLDFMLKPADAERALQALADAGMRPERPPEPWLFKAYDGDVMIDLIFRPTSGEVTDELFERADEIELSAMPMLVMSLEDLLVTKLLVLKEHEVDYESVLEIARTLREQIDFEDVRRRTEDSPYAKAFFTLVDELGVTS
jgi:hypothetical protein